MSQPYVVSSDWRVLKMAPDNRPAMTVPPHTSVVFETLDCFSNRLADETRPFTSGGWENINPATGPVAVEGAQPGDVLRVDIIDIAVDDQAVIAAAPGFGEMPDSVREKTRIVPIRDGFACLEWQRTGGKPPFKANIPVDPMIGVIGVAPKEDAVPTGTPGAHGGNMDCNRITRGASLYLPVAVPGALFALGDLHALMGDGEVVVCGLEISGRVTVSFSIIKDRSWPLPLLVQKDTFMTLASAKTLDEAARQATQNMQKFLVEELAFEPTEAAMLLSVQGNLRICQVVDPLKTARMEIPLSLLADCGYVLP